jgi:hypothetical protein
MFFRTYTACFSRLWRALMLHKRKNLGKETKQFELDEQHRTVSHIYRLAKLYLD